MTHTCENPHLTLTALEFNFTLVAPVIGNFRSDLAPIPNLPSKLSPYEYNDPSLVMKLTCFSETDISIISWKMVVW